MELRFRDAGESDLAAIVRLLVDDDIASERDDASEPLAAEYGKAFEDMSAQGGNRVLLAEGLVDGEWLVVACSQLVAIPGLSRKGMKRAQLEHVRVSSEVRGQGVGRRFFEYVIDTARAEGCGMVQLTADVARSDAHRFYQSLGFRSTHQGFKLHL
jgi:GNAT superfamily N-acetyltransferase